MLLSYILDILERMSTGRKLSLEDLDSFYRQLQHQLILNLTEIIKIYPEKKFTLSAKNFGLFIFGP